MTRIALPVLAGLIAIAASPMVLAQTTPKAPAGKAQTPAAKTLAAPQVAQPAAPARPTFHVEGFRSAHFGMTQDQVKAAIAKDFNIQPAAIAASQNPIDGTSALSIKVDHLDPGPGAAGISYIFGASTKTLVHINLAWATGGAPTVDDRKGVVTAALRLAVYFQNQGWPPNRTVSGALMANNVVLIFEGVDDAGGGVEVSTAGVPLESADPKAPKIPEPTGPAQLKVSYSANHDHPDVLKIAPGAF
jgi:hypothetical protein